MVFSLVTKFFYSRVAMFRASFQFGSLEAEKASSCSKPFTALMLVVKIKPVEPFLRCSKMFPKESKMESGEPDSVIRILLIFNYI